MKSERKGKQEGTSWRYLHPLSKQSRQQSIHQGAPELHSCSKLQRGLLSARIIHLVIGHNGRATSWLLTLDPAFFPRTKLIYFCSWSFANRNVTSHFCQCFCLFIFFFLFFIICLTSHFVMCSSMARYI